MTTSYPSQDASAKKVSTTLSAKKSLDDLTGWDIERYVRRNHLRAYKGSIAAWTLSREIAELYNLEKGGFAFPNIATLSARLLMSDRTISRYIEKMREAVDDNGKPLWRIVRGYKIGNNSSANLYYPLFLEDVLASLNESGKPDEAEAVSLEDAADEATANPALSASDDDMDTQALESDENVSGVHDLFDDVEAVFDTPAANQEQEAQAETAYVLPASWLMQSDEQMMAKVLELVKREKNGESKTPYTKPPALDADTFTNLEVGHQRFLNAFIRYIMHLGNTSQDELNATAANMVEQWSQEKASGSSTFYLKFLSEYLKTWKGFM